MIKQDKPNKKPLYYYYAIAVLAVILLNELLFPSIIQSGVKQVGYDTFLEMVDDGAVTQVEMDEENDRILFVTEEDGKARYYKTGIFPDDGLRERLEAADDWWERLQGRPWLKMRLRHMLQMGHTKEDIIAGLCNAVASNYLNNVGKGKKIVPPIVFQGGVSKNIGVVEAFQKMLGYEIQIDENGHLIVALGAAILAEKSEKRREFDFSMEDTPFQTREICCGRCANNCEIMCVYRDNVLVDSWGNRCEKGEYKSP